VVLGFEVTFQLFSLKGLQDEKARLEKDLQAIADTNPDYRKECVEARTICHRLRRINRDMGRITKGKRVKV
jgi:hypothetical protein